jgi:membrane protease YdiL (CAAX protease family)
MPRQQRLQQQAAAAGSSSSSKRVVSLQLTHFLARQLLCCSAGLQVFWRGFFLTALTKVLPLPACVAFSSLNFAVLHLSPHNLLPLLVLSSCCDCLYLRSSGNLLAPLLLHGMWNASQLLQIALLHKETFV